MWWLAGYDALSTMERFGGNGTMGKIQKTIVRTQERVDKKAESW